MSVVYYVCLNLLTELWWCVWKSASRAAGGRFLSTETAFETAWMGSYTIYRIEKNATFYLVVVKKKKRSKRQQLMSSESLHAP